MASDFSLFQQISQSFSSGSSYQSASCSTGSKSPQGATGLSRASLTDSDFQKTLRKTSQDAGPMNKSSSYGSRESHGEKNGVRTGGNGNETADAITHEQNFLGCVKPLQQESQVAIGDQGIDAQRNQLLQMLKQLGIELSPPAEHGNLNGSNVIHANVDETALAHVARHMDTAKLEALLVQFQTGTDARTSAELQRIIDVFKGIATDKAAGNTGSDNLTKAFQETVAKTDAATIFGSTQHDGQRIDTSAAVNNDKANMGEVVGDPASKNSLPNASSDRIMAVIQNAQGSANAKMHGDQVSAATEHQKPNVAEHLNSQSTVNGSGQEQNNARRVQLNEGIGSPSNNAEATLFSNLSANKVHNDSQSLKSAVPTSDATSTLNIDNKIINSDAAKDDGFLFRQKQNELKTIENSTIAKEAETGTKDIRSQTLDQIVQKAVLHLKNGRNEVQINLKPDFLGNLRMQIVTESQHVTVRILAELPMVKDLIENNLQLLKSELQNCGLEIDELEVSVQHGSDQHVADQKNASGATTANSAGNKTADEDTESAHSAASRPGTITSNENATIDFFI